MSLFLKIIGKLPISCGGVMETFEETKPLSSCTYGSITNIKFQILAIENNT